MATGIAEIQTQINPDLASDQWVDTQHFDAFNLGATFVTNMWLFFPAIIILGLMYYGYVEAQRRQD